MKKRKVDSECCVFNTEWTSKYFVTHVGSKAVCLICQNAISVFKEYNIKRHFSTKHSNYATNLSSREREQKALKLSSDLTASQNIFVKQTAIQETVTKVSYMLAHKIAKHSRSFSEGVFERLYG